MLCQYRMYAELTKAISTYQSHSMHATIEQTRIQMLWLTGMLQENSTAYIGSRDMRVYFAMP